MDTHLEGNDEISIEKSDSPLQFLAINTKSSPRRLLNTALSGVATFVTLLVLGSAFIRLLSRTRTISGCGNSASEARANNCMFDQLLYAWVPKACFPQVLHDQYLSNAQNATWFLHTDTSEISDVATIEEGQIGMVYTNDEWRGQQCTYLWESLSRGVYEGKEVADQAANLTQSADCARMFLDVFDLGVESNPRKWLKQKLQFLKCRVLTARDL